MRQVLILQASIKQYREPFFRRLHARLQDDNVTLRVAYGEPSRIEAAKGDNVVLPDEIRIMARNRWLMGDRFLWQPVWNAVAAADLVIVEHASKHLINYPLLAMSALQAKKVAFWGHGRNRQAQSAGVSDWVKRVTATRAGWWFTYTRGTQAYLCSIGVPPQRITTVQNSIDTDAFRAELDAVDPEQVAAARGALGITEGAPVGLFCGSLYGHKKWAVLLEAAALVRAHLPDFQLLIIGEGPDARDLTRQAAGMPGVHVLGARFGSEKACYFRMADVCLNPGLVGLAILDAFTAGLPVLTMDLPLHSPEIEYLVDGLNGYFTADDAVAYADRIVSVLSDAGKLASLRAGALDASRRYSMDAMVDNFRHGILQFLETRP